MKTVQLTDAEQARVISSLKTARSIPGGMVREFPELEKRANDPNDSAHKVLTARLPGIRQEYESAKLIVEGIDALLAKLEG